MLVGQLGPQDVVADLEIDDDVADVADVARSTSMSLCIDCIDVLNFSDSRPRGLQSDVRRL